jgi:hypothetical protein
VCQIPNKKMGAISHYYIESVVHTLRQRLFFSFYNFPKDKLKQIYQVSQSRKTGKKINSAYTKVVKSLSEVSFNNY